MLRIESMERAKPMFWASARMAVLMPTTCPDALTSGPPLLPGLMAASVWIRLSSESPDGAVIDRLRADTMPVVTLGASPRLSALPMATTSSPTCRSDDEPSSAAVTGSVSSSAFTSATSASGTEPSRRASDVRPSAKSTSMVWAPSTTWALVRTSPSSDSTTPEPAASPPRTPVWMDTTEGRTFSNRAWMSSCPPGMVAAGRDGVLHRRRRGTVTPAVPQGRSGDAAGHDGADQATDEGGTDAAAPAGRGSPGGGGGARSDRGGGDGRPVGRAGRGVPAGSGEGGGCPRCGRPRCGWAGRRGPLRRHRRARRGGGGTEQRGGRRA